MRSNRFRGVAPLLKEGLSWAVLLLGIALGGLSTILVARVPVPRADWSGLFGFGLLGFSLLSSILALRNRRQAGWLYLVAAPAVSGCLAWWQRWPPYEVPSPPSLRLVLILVGTACLIIFPYPPPGLATFDCKPGDGGDCSAASCFKHVLALGRGVRVCVRVFVSPSIRT